jgi:LacI family transcriptional regulator
MPQRRVTSRQVAERAGVSQTTVSFVLNNVERANISEETRQRVLNAAGELGYVPDSAARSLARGRSSNIGLILVQPHEHIFTDQYVSNIIMGINSVIRQRGFRLLIEVVADDSPPDTLGNLAQGKEVAGMIVVVYFPRPEQLLKLKSLANEGFPIVMLGHPSNDFYAVIGDYFAGVRQAVNHIISLGHQRIACIPYGPLNNDRHAAKRLRVYREMLESHGLVYDENLIRCGNYNPESGFQAMKALLQVQPRPTALFAMNDAMAFGAMTAIQDSGLHVPDDIAVVGFDDIPLAAYTTPALTTINAHDVEQGAHAGDLLAALIDGQMPPENHIMLEPSLIIRSSCGAKLSVQPINNN